MSKFCPICRARYPETVTVCPEDGMKLFKRADDHLGRLIAGRYELQDKIGSGGMALVYRAVDRVTGGRVAVKLLRPHLARLAEQRVRFLREVRAARAARHENIVEIHEVGETLDGDAFMVMELIEGATIGDSVRKGLMDLACVAMVVREICLGISKAHQVGVLHRDLKPENVILTHTSPREVRLKILDFGLAQMSGDLRLTETGQVFGTPEYLSPEQATGAGASPASDQYAAGIVFYEMLTGKPPFQGSPANVMMAHIKSPPVPPSIAPVARRVPEIFDHVVLRMLAKLPKERYPDMDGVRDDIEAILAAGV